MRSSTKGIATSPLSIDGEGTRARGDLSHFSRLALVLKQTSESLFERLQQVFRVANAEFYQNQTLPGWTDHSLRHIQAVLKYTDKLLNVGEPNGSRRREPLTDGEAFLLLSSILLHDIGQAAHDLTYNDPQETFRRHGEKTADIIRDFRNIFGFGDHEADFVGKICKSHSVREYRKLAGREWSIDSLGTCRPHPVMALLRIADLLDLTHSRAPSFIFRLRRLPAMNRKHWERHAIISDVVINSNEWIIKVFARPQSIKQADSLREFGKWLQEELDCVAEDFSVFGLYYSRILLEVDSSAYRRVVSPTPSANPFIGVSAFPTSKSEMFFGRDGQIARIVGLSQANKLLALVGESGVGKTSLVNAGVIPALAADGTVCVTYRFSAPIRDTLRRAICTALKLEDNAEWADALKHIRLGEDRCTDLCLHIDQFEELFTHSFSKEERSDLVEMISGFLAEDLSSRIVLSIRSEFLIELCELARTNLPFFILDGIHRVPKLGSDMARDAIEKPLGQFQNLIWEPGLVDALLIDLTDEGPGVYPPYLQLVCQKLVSEKFAEIARLPFEERENQFVIDLSTYLRLGKAARIIREYFQGILDDFSREERTVIDEVLARMITQYNSRRPVAVEDLEKINRGRIKIIKVMEKLVNSRVVKRRDNQYELEHDILARELINLLRSSVKASTKITEIIEFIEENLEKPLPLSDLSKIADLSESQLIRRFRAETDLTPLKYVLKARIEAAKALLKDTEDPVRLIAKSCGFGSPVHFNTIFKRLTRQTPRAYRDAVRQTYAEEFTVY